MIDVERVKIRIETVTIRFRAIFRMFAQVFGASLLILAAYNFILAPTVVTPAFAPYRPFLVPFFAAGLGTMPSWAMADITVMVVGAIIGWFS